MHRRSGVIAAALAAFVLQAAAQAQSPPKEDAAKAPDGATATPAPKPPARPRVVLKPRGGTGSNVGDDAPGGGATSGQASKGGTPGTPSGSFTGGGATP